MASGVVTASRSNDCKSVLMLTADPVGSEDGPWGVRSVSSPSTLNNERTLRMIALTRYFHIVAASVAASLTAILLSSCNIADTWYVCAFVGFLFCHRKSSDRILI